MTYYNSLIWRRRIQNVAWKDVYETKVKAGCQGQKHVSVHIVTDYWSVQILQETQKWTKKTERY